jgi:prephenate dehydratase
MDRHSLTGWPSVSNQVTIAYLGPEGSFCHQAALMLATHADELAPMKDVKSVVAAVENGIVQHGLVPIENSVEGEVTSTVHEIVFNTATVVVREEVVIPVSFFAFTSSAQAVPVTAMSHPFALAQCQKFISRRGLVTKTSDSTSAACQTLAEHPDESVVALGSELAGQLYGLQVFEKNIEDNKLAHTKFYLLSRELPAERGHGDYRTWIALVPPDNRTGVLADILTTFSSRDLAVFSVSSRPLRAEIGAYCFILTTAGWLGDKAVKEALQELFEMECTVRILGTFRAWGGAGVVPSIVDLDDVSPGLTAGFNTSFPPIPWGPA